MAVLEHALSNLLLPTLGLHTMQCYLCLLTPQDTVSLLNTSFAMYTVQHVGSIYHMGDRHCDCSRSTVYVVDQQ